MTESLPATLFSLDNDLSDSKPTHVRWWILGLVVLIMLVEAMQRASMGIAGKGIQDEFHLTTQQLGWILSAFGLGQTVSQIPWGYAGDRYGPRRVLMLAILCSAFSSAAIGFTPGRSIFAWLSVALFLMGMRFLGGVGMAAAPSNSNKIVSLWMSPGERATGSSAIPFGSGLGSGIAPILTVITMQAWGWRFSYFLYAAIACSVALIWWVFSTNRPEQHPRVNAAELKHIRGGVQPDEVPTAMLGHGRRLPWSRMLRSRSLWVISLSFTCQQYAIMVFQTWFFIYLVKSRGLTLTQAGFWGATPFICMVLFSPFGGRASDLAVRYFGRSRGRRSTVWLGMGLSAVLLWTGSHTHNNAQAIVILAIAAGFNYFALSAYWAACIDLAPNYSASVSSLMNTFGSFGGWLAPIVTAFVATRWGWPRAIDVAALVTAMSGFLWIFANLRKGIKEY
ncbi:MAG TPA: MFS transporter [Candidatus Acidoferrales bacterium]|nr:MFS transporter [Candidatus Acidoferrales bacterium]